MTSPQKALDAAELLPKPPMEPTDRTIRELLRGLWKDLTHRRMLPASADDDLLPPILIAEMDQQPEDHRIREFERLIYGIVGLATLIAIAVTWAG